MRRAKDKRNGSGLGAIVTGVPIVASLLVACAADRNEPAASPDAVAIFTGGSVNDFGPSPQGAGSSGSNAPAIASGTSAGDVLDIIVAPAADGSLPDQLWVGCESGPNFQIADLTEIVPLRDADPGGVAKAIRSFLSDEEGQSWPQHNWLVLRQTEDEVLLVHADGDDLSFMTTEKVDGAWQWASASSGGPCPLHYLVPEGLNAVDWWIDPQTPTDADDTRLSILVRERECVSGQGIGNRLRGPQVVLTDDAVRVAFAAEPPPGSAFTCPGNPESAVTVELPEPLGDRTVIEGLAIGIALEDYLP